MANTLTNILDKILAGNLRILRENLVMARLVNRNYQPLAAQKGSTIDIPIPVAQTVADITAAPTYSSAANTTPNLVQVTMSNWRGTDFFLTDKDMTEIDANRHFLPGQMKKAAIALAQDIDNAIMGTYRGIYGYVGTAGTAPFSTVATATDARKVLNQQLAPLDVRNIVLDPTAEAQALQLQAFSNLEQTGDPDVKINGDLGRKFGMNFFMSQNVSTHTAGTMGSAAVGSTTAVGVSALAIKAQSTAAGGTLVTGDVFTIAGDSQTYVVTNASTTVSVTSQNVTIDPPLKVIASADAVITLKATHTVNLGFHPDAFVFVTRPLAQSMHPGRRAATSMMADDMTGIQLRVEVLGQSSQDAIRLDVLYGQKLVLPELGVRIAG
jgi:hypothetical protein